MSDSSEDPLTPSPENTHVQTMSLGSEPAAIPYSVKLNGEKLQNPLHGRWSMENAIVKDWLIGTMEPDLMNRSVIYDLSRRVMQMRQDGRPISTYYADLRAIWQELDNRKPITFSQPDVMQARQKEIDEERVYIFLVGLYDLYDGVPSDILCTEPFPNPENAFAVVRSEEQRRNTMLHSQMTPSVAMATKTALTQNRSSFPSKNQGGSESGFSHSRNPKHAAVDNCFKLSGYPDWWDNLNERKSRVIGIIERPETREMAKPQ
ncbi:hypothetical protein GYH30_046714 [Glycine max]|nr:hypothetical protein GYH30_046714 [Glycine max]